MHEAEAAGDDASRRLCAATRLPRDPAELIRFVAAPDGSLVPDLARRLPGRGVWVTADRASLQQAVKIKAFARSLKRAVTVAADLPDVVEAQLLKRAMEALALANKAGAVSPGFEQVDALIGSGDAVALAHGSDAAAGGRAKLDRKFEAVQRDRGRQAPIVDVLTIEQMSLAMGRSNVVHAGLIHGGATERFLTEAERLKRFRSGICASGSARDASPIACETDNV